MTDIQPGPVGPRTTDERNAPVVFFDGAPTFGAYNHVVAITLSVGLARPGPDGTVVGGDVVAAYLRTNIEGARSLRDSLDKAILMASDVHGEAN